MTTVEVIVYLEDVSSRVRSLEWWRKSKEGVGRFQVVLDNTGGYYNNTFLADDPITIKVNGYTVLKGYLDRGRPIVRKVVDIFQQEMTLTGRDLGQDLHNKRNEKMYRKQPADDIIDDMLNSAGCEITFTSPGTAPQIQFTEPPQYLSDAIRKILEKINYDAYVDNTKAFQMFAQGSGASQFTLKAVAGAADNNILDPVERDEFDAYELRNYIIVRGPKIDDGYSEGNADGWQQEYAGGTITDETNIAAGLVKKGIASIKFTKPPGNEIVAKLTFPRYNWPFLPFERYWSERTGIWVYADYAGPLYIQLEDNNGDKIGIYAGESVVNEWVQLAVSVGLGCDIATWSSGLAKKWFYVSPSVSFNWKVVAIRIYQSPNMNTMYLDGLSLPFIMLAIAQDGGSQGSYKVRQIPLERRNVRTQKELEDYATSQAAKRKTPLKPVTLVADGNAGLVAGIMRWIPGWVCTVNIPDDAINNVEYRMINVHGMVLENPRPDGHDLIVEVDLIPKADDVDTLQYSYIKEPDVGLMRDIRDRLEFLEKQQERMQDMFPTLPRPLSHKYELYELSASDHHADWRDPTSPNYIDPLALYKWLAGNSGTSFPADPVDRELFFRTDLNTVYRYSASLLDWIGVDKLEDAARIADFIITKIKTNGWFLIDWLLENQLQSDAIQFGIDTALWLINTQDGATITIAELNNYPAIKIYCPAKTNGDPYGHLRTYHATFRIAGEFMFGFKADPGLSKGSAFLGLVLAPGTGVYFEWDVDTPQYNLYAVCFVDIANYTRTLIEQGAQILNEREYKIEMKPSGCKFYVNGTLKTTITTNIPTVSLNVWASCKNQAAATTAYLYLRNLLIQKI